MQSLYHRLAKDSRRGRLTATLMPIISVPMRWVNGSLCEQDVIDGTPSVTMSTDMSTGAITAVTYRREKGIRKNLAEEAQAGPVVPYVAIYGVRDAWP